MRISANGTNQAAQPERVNVGAAREDGVTKSLKKQIANLQEQMRRLSENDKMDLEEKMKKRQELQQQIAALTQQIHQHEIELRREAMEGKKQGGQEQKTSEGTEKTRRKSSSSGKGAQKQNRTNSAGGAELSADSMTALISADSSMKLAGVQKSVGTAAAGRAGVLRAEIKTDEGKTDVSQKQEELAEAEQTAAAAMESSAGTLGRAIHAAEEAAAEERDGKIQPGAEGKQESDPEDIIGLKTGKTAEEKGETVGDTERRAKVKMGSEKKAETAAAWGKTAQKDKAEESREREDRPKNGMRRGRVDVRI